LSKKNSVVSVADNSGVRRPEGIKAPRRWKSTRTALQKKKGHKMFYGEEAQRGGDRYHGREKKKLKRQGLAKKKTERCFSPQKCGLHRWIFLGGEKSHNKKGNLPQGLLTAEAFGKKEKWDGTRSHAKAALYDSVRPIKKKKIEAGLLKGKRKEKTHRPLLPKGGRPVMVTSVADPNGGGPKTSVLALGGGNGP